MKTLCHVLTNSCRRRNCCRLVGCATLSVGFFVCLMLLLGAPSSFVSKFAWHDDDRDPPIDPSGDQPRDSIIREPAYHNESSSIKRPSTSIEEVGTERYSSRSSSLSGPLKGSRCGEGLHRPPEDLRESFEWQRATTGHDNTFVFSAHFDPSGSKATVVVVGISSDYSGPGVIYLCHVWFSSSRQAEVCSAERYSHSESHGRRHTATFFTCHFEGDEGIPYAVSLVRSEQRCQSADNVLAVVSPPTIAGGGGGAGGDAAGVGGGSGADGKVNFTVCVTPLNYDFDDVNRLVETVELNRMFGADRLIFYNFTTGSSIKPYLRLYMEEGVVEVVPWKLPIQTDDYRTKAYPEIHYFGQLAALNECLMRNRYRSRYVAFTDLDEVVVPRRHNTWFEMLEELRQNQMRNKQKAIASFHFRNVFFRIDYEQDPVYENSSTVTRLRLRSLLTTVREAKTFPHGWRSKHIVCPEAVQLVGIHHIEKILDYSKTSVLDVDDSTALLHHYRSWTGEEVTRSMTSTDRTMHRFADRIISRVLAIHRRLIAG